MKSANLPKALILCCVLLFSASRVQAQDWPQWRGPNRDNRVAGFLAPKTWPKELTQNWEVTVGLGESSPVLVGDKIFIFARQGPDEVTTCLDVATGKELWKDKYAAVAVTNAAKPHPGPRSSPAVADGKVCTLGVGGVVSCLDAATGTVLWRKDTKSWPQYYTACSPIIVDGKCIVYAGPLTAFDLVSGEPKWEWKGGGAPYGSPVLLMIDGTKQLVTPTMGALAGINLADGKVLWQVTISGNYNNTTGTPVIGDQTVYYSGPDNGMMALKIEKQGNDFSAKELWKKTLASHRFNTPVLKDGMLFGISTKRNFYCVDAKSGAPLWPADKADTTQRSECGTIIDAGPVLMALGSDGQLVVLEPTGKEFKQVAAYKVSEGTGLEGPWAYPIIAGNRVFVKDRDTLTLWTIESKP
jgi:outer membrane protein assembly factor BamB